MMACGLLTVATVLSAPAVLIDRVAVVVGRVPILDSEIDRDIRITAFLNQVPLEISNTSRKQAASRLIDQELIRQQIRLGGYPTASLAEARQFLDGIEKSRFSSVADFTKALTQYGITEPVLVDRLAWQLTVLRFIDTMFRPQAVVSDSDIQSYYDSHRSVFGSQPLSVVRPVVIETITGKQINRLFTQWLDQNRKSAHIVYLEKSLA